MARETNPIRDAVDRRLSTLCVPDDLARKVTARARGRKPPRIVRLRRPIAVAAVLCFVVAASVGVLASAAPSTQNLFSVLGAQVSSLLQPIERSRVASGIETTVVAAMNDNNAVDIYVAVRDLEDTRINAHTDLGDVQLTGLAFSPSVQLVQFDEKSATATFLIEGMCGEELNGKKVTLSIGAILLNGSDHEAQNTRVSVADIAAAYPSPQFQTLTGDRACSTLSFSDDALSFEGDTALLPAASDGAPEELLPWGSLAAGGVSNGALHLLVKPSAVGKYAQFTSVYLTGGRRGDTEKLPVHTIEFGACDTVGTNQYFEYTEYVLPLPKNADPKKLMIAYRGILYEDVVAGKWETTFQLESVSRQHIAYPDFTVDGWHITRVELSAMGVCVVMDDDSSSAMPPKLAAYDKNGVPIEVNGSSSSWNGSEHTFKNQFATPTPLDQISKVTVGGKEIAFK